MAFNIFIRIKASLPHNVPQAIKYITQYRLDYPDFTLDRELNMILINLRDHKIAEATLIVDRTFLGL